MQPDEPKPYINTSQVAKILGVSPKTVSRWAKENKLPYQRTLGGHRRYPGDEIRELRARLEHTLSEPQAGLVRD